MTKKNQEEIKTIISEKCLLKIKERVSLELTKRGFHVELIDFKEAVTKERHRITFGSTSFQTAPVLFKEIIVGNFSSGINKDEREESRKGWTRYNVWFQVNVSYEHFSGGRNGCQLFSYSCNYWEDSLAEQHKISHSGISNEIIS